MNISDDLLRIEQLASSCDRQADLYGKLRQLVQTILGKLTLSRGDVSGVMKLFTEKQGLLDAVMLEKDAGANLVTWWQENKSRLGTLPESHRMTTAIDRIEGAIKAFLAAEEQLERYLKHLTGKPS